MFPLERVGVGGAGRDHVGGDQDVLGADQGGVDQDVLHRGGGGSGCGKHGKGSLKALEQSLNYSRLIKRRAAGMFRGVHPKRGENTRGRGSCPGW